MPQNAKLSEADGVVSNSAPPTTGLALWAVNSLLMKRPQPNEYLLVRMLLVGWWLRPSLRHPKNANYGSAEWGLGL